MELKPGERSGLFTAGEPARALEEFRYVKAKLYTNNRNILLFVGCLRRRSWRHETKATGMQ